MDTFYTILPSNTPFLKNTTSNYLVKLPNIIDLSDGNWTVALSSIVYPQSFLGNDEVQTLKIYYKNKNIQSINFPNVKYHSIADLQHKINNVIKENTNDPETIAQLHNKNELESAQLIAVNVFKESDTVFNKIIELKNKIKEKLDLHSDKNIPNAEKNKTSFKKSAKITDDLHKRALSLINILRDFITRSHQSYIEGNLLEIALNTSNLKKQNENLKEVYDNLIVLNSQIDTKLAEITPFAALTPTKLLNENKNLEFLPTVLKETNVDESIDKWNIIESVDTTSESYNLAKTKVLQSIDENIKKEQPIYFYFDYDSHQRFFLWADESVEKVHLSAQLAYILGFTINDQGFTCLNSFAKYTTDISGGLHSFFVYAPELVENTIIGNQYGPLLRVINIDQNSKTSIVESIYTQEFHYKVLPKQLSEIRIQILSDTGKPIAFNWGNCIVTLHFQRSLF